MKEENVQNVKRSKMHSNWNPADTSQEFPTGPLSVSLGHN